MIDDAEDREHEHEGPDSLGEDRRSQAVVDSLTMSCPISEFDPRVRKDGPDAQRADHATQDLRCPVGRQPLWPESVSSEPGGGDRRIDVASETLPSA